MDNLDGSLYGIESMPAPAIRHVAAAVPRGLFLAGWQPWESRRGPRPSGIVITQPIFRGRRGRAAIDRGPRVLLHQKLHGVHVEKYLGTNDHQRTVYRVLCLHCRKRVTLEGRQIRNPNREGCGECRPRRRTPAPSEGKALTFGGRTMSISAWARALRRRGITRRCIQSRLANDWTIEEALTTPSARAS